MGEKIKIPDIQRNEIKEKEFLTALRPELEHDIYISEILKRKLEEIIIEIKERKKLGYLAGIGAIFSGFQGVGKTVLVKKLAKDLGIELIFCIDKEMMPAQISKTFEEAKKLAQEGKNVFVFIDEIDSFGQKEYARYGSGLSKITTLMTELDGIKKFNPKGIYYVFAATNYLENVDERLLRPGRLEEIIEVPLPDYKARKEILKIHQANKAENPHSYKFSDEIIEYLAKKTNGYTPADLRSLVKHCAIKARKRNSNKVDLKDAEEALNEFVVSIKRGLEYFVEPKFSLKDVIGREVYIEFFNELLSKQDEAKILCYGPRGVGKTMLPEALACDKEYSFIYVRGSELQEGIVGEGTKKLKKLFQRAQMAAPCIVLLDEIKGIVTARHTISHKDDETAYLNSLLSRPLPGVYLFVTTNNPLEINETTLSRFEYKVFFDLPASNEREEYFKKKLNDNINGYAVDLAIKTQNYSFRDLERIVRSLNRIENKINGNDYPRGKIIDYIISRYIPENSDDDINWKAVRNTIGDSMEVEKFVDYIMKNKDKEIK
jgi:SpoVK/Ycf46/Vps4 family AAA+-type ATPase